MIEKRIVVFDAPSNLGLNPPEDGVVPGCYKAPWALRDLKLLEALNAIDGGCLVPPRYNSRWKPDEGDRNATAIADYSVRLADRLESLRKNHKKVLILGGDCSILIGSMLALKRHGRYGLVYLDAHSDFRHPGNSEVIGAAAGEDLAIVTGLGDSRLTNLEDQIPYVLKEDIHVLGIRDRDDSITELRSKNIKVSTSGEIMGTNLDLVITDTLKTVTHNTLGFWIHLDLDVVDSSEMSAVDSPEPNGLTFSVLTDLLNKLFLSTKCIGLELTIYDPDLDPTGDYAEKIVNCLQEAFSN
jgi:arginase